jgi:hypothetical protein
LAGIVGGGLQSGAAPGGPGSGDYQDIKGDVPKGKEGYVTKSSSAVGKEGMIFTTGETKGAPDDAGPSSVPYYEVLPDYQKAKEKALAKEEVPPAYRKRVTDYFDSLSK